MLDGEEYYGWFDLNGVFHLTNLKDYDSDDDEIGQQKNNKENGILDGKPPEDWCKFSEEVNKISTKLASIVRNAVPQSLDAPDLKLVFKKVHLLLHLDLEK